ncbi:MAG: amidase domain-containing protein [Eubacteriales bacterium]
MFFVLKAKHIIAFGVLFIFLSVMAVFLFDEPEFSYTTVIESLDEDGVQFLIDQIFNVRNEAILKGDSETVRKLYDTDKTNGLYAYDHEEKKIKYLANWSEKQGVTFTYINSNVTVKWSKEKGSGYTVNLLVSTTYKYIYKDRPAAENVMRIGTYHQIDLANYDGTWLITKEWYTDPFADSLNLDKLKTDDITALILSNEARDFSSIGESRIAAIKYADQYVGAADSGENEFNYNSDYKNYNSLGGDCANFASQILYEAGNFKKNGTWNYAKDGSSAWLNAQAFKNYLLYSGRGSLIVSGTYSEVLELSYKLLPGDIVAYVKKGKVTHVSIITGADSRGYALVNCHNTDRFRVPWDLGWSDSGIKFYLIRVNY